MPWGPTVDHVSDEPLTAMTFKLYGDEGTYQHYQDDGADFKYQNGEFNIYAVQVKAGQVSVTLSHHGYEPVYQRVTVELTDQAVTLVYDQTTGTYQAE